MSLSYNNQDEVWGVLRNSVLINTYLPGWTVRVFLSNNSNSPLPQKILNKLFSLNTTVVLLSDMLVGNLPSQILSYVVTDDPEVEYFLILNPTQRLSGRDAISINKWISSNVTMYNCVTKPLHHKNQPPLYNIWGGRRRQFNQLMGQSLLPQLLSHFKNSRPESGHNVTEAFWERSMRPRLQNERSCRGKTSCDYCPAGAIGGSSLNLYDQYEQIIPAAEH